MIPTEPRPTHCILFADGAKGSATQVWATLEPGTFLVLRRPDRKTPFAGELVHAPPDAKAMDVLALATKAAQAPRQEAPPARGTNLRPKPANAPDAPQAGARDLFGG